MTEHEYGDKINYGEDDFFFGCLESHEEDSRDYNIAQFIPNLDPIEDLEFMLDLPEIQIIKHQYSYSACVGFAYAMAHSIAEYQLTNKWIDFDPFVIYGTDYSEKKGMQLKQGANILLNHGGFFKRDFGKTGEHPDICRLVKRFKNNNPELVKVAKTFAIEGYANVKTVDDIKRALKNKMPVVCSYRVRSDFSVADAKEGVIPYPRSGSSKERHAMVIVGWKMVDGYPHWVVLNSWGTLRGYKGIYFIDCRNSILEAYSISNHITPAKKKCKEIEFTIGSNIFIADGEFKEFESRPYIKNKRTYLPVRFVAENLGASVEWDAKSGTAIIRSEEAIIKITENSNIININGKDKEIDTTPEITLEGRMMLPIRFIAEALNCKIKWDGINSKVTIIAL